MKGKQRWKQSLTHKFGHIYVNKRFNIDCKPYFCGESTCSGRDLWSDWFSVIFKALADITLLPVKAGTLWSQVNLNEVFKLTCYTMAREACNASSDINYRFKFNWVIWIRLNATKQDWLFVKQALHTRKQTDEISETQASAL